MKSVSHIAPGVEAVVLRFRCHRRSRGINATVGCALLSPTERLSSNLRPDHLGSVKSRRGVFKHQESASARGSG